MVVLRHKMIFEFEAPVTDLRTLFCYAEDGIDIMTYFLLPWWIIGVEHALRDLNGIYPCKCLANYWLKIINVFASCVHSVFVNNEYKFLMPHKTFNTVT